MYRRIHVYILTITYIIICAGVKLKYPIQVICNSCNIETSTILSAYFIKCNFIWNMVVLKHMYTTCFV